MPNALDTYGEYARLIFTLLTNRPSVERHTLAVYTTSQTVGACFYRTEPAATDR